MVTLIGFNALDQHIPRRGRPKDARPRRNHGPAHIAKVNLPAISRDKALAKLDYISPQGGEPFADCGDEGGRIIDHRKMAAILAHDE